LAICVSVPLAILSVVLGIMGFRTYSDFQKIQNKSEEVKQEVNQTLTEVQLAQRQMADASRALSGISKLQSDAAQLQSQVAQLKTTLIEQQHDQNQLNKQLQRQLAEASTALKDASRVQTDAAELQRMVSTIRNSLVEQQKSLNNLDTRTAYVEQIQLSQVQTKLKALGFYEGDISGKLDEPTRAAVAAFQRKEGMAADGILGPQTLAKLNSK
jgi:murein L,D-transpeptidase YcbB/YkuD